MIGYLTIQFMVKLKKKKMNENAMPCWFCDYQCGVIMMSHCEKLELWIKLDRDNETKNQETI